MKTILAFIFFFGGVLIARADPELDRIFGDIKFMCYQLSLDNKVQDTAPSQEVAPQPQKHAHNKKKEAPVLVSVAPSPVTRVFSGTTVWGDLNVKVLDFGTHMTLQVKSSVPAQGWMLQQGSSNNILFKGNVESNALSFQIEIPHQYSKDLGLTVIVNSSDGQNPAYIALK